MDFMKDLMWNEVLGAFFGTGGAQRSLGVPEKQTLISPFLHGAESQSNSQIPANDKVALWLINSHASDAD